MFKLDFSDLQENGYKISHLRLKHSYKFKGANFEINVKCFTDNDDLPVERDLYVEYLTESMEIDYTFYIVFKVICYFSFFLMIVSLFVFGNHFVFPTVLILLSAIFWFLYRKRKDNFGMGKIALDTTMSIYTDKINAKYNFIASPK